MQIKILYKNTVMQPQSTTASSHARMPAGVWRASERPTALTQVVPTGHAALDACLPGAGWPCGALSEVLQPPGVHLEWQLVLPAMVNWQRTVAEPGQPPRPGVVLIGPPEWPFVPALEARGLRVADLVHVQPADAVQRLWACEQALQCAHVGAVLAWLPHAPMDALRRLQWAATRHGGLLWVFRLEGVAQQATPAMLRLRVAPGDVPQTLQVTVLKRRGPPLAQPLRLTSPDTGLAAVLAAARWRQARRRVAAPGVVVPASRSIVSEVSHALPAALAGFAVSAD